jgi:hypothetical protein
MTQPNHVAFPNNESAIEFKGLSKREYFAGIALQGLLARPSANPSEENPERAETLAFPSPSGMISCSFSTTTELAAYAVSLADALIAELDKTQVSHKPVPGVTQR